jgi:hypothetical protein
MVLAVLMLVVVLCLLAIVLPHGPAPTTFPTVIVQAPPEETHIGGILFILMALVTTMLILAFGG